MTLRRILPAACALALLPVVPALAQSRPPAQIKITNARTVPLESLEITTTGEQARLVGKLAKPLAPGKSTTEIDKIAREIITKAGFGEAFGHGLGHGVGLHAHEEPRLSHMLAGTRLEAGQVVTIEPGIYLPGVGGVRIEDVYVVTGEGSKNLCSLPRTMEWGTLQ